MQFRVGNYYIVKASVVLVAVAHSQAVDSMADKVEEGGR